jgi:hypothetical protein
MDTSILLYNKILQMPEDVKKEVDNFIDFIMSKKGKENKFVETEKDEVNKRPFGILKGKIKMADDFDAPMDDFKDYM